MFINSKVHDLQNPRKKIEENQISELQGVVKTALTCLNKLNRNDNTTITAQSKSTDEIFGELVVKTLGEIKGCEEKNLIKLQMQQKLIKLKYQKLRQYQRGDSLLSPTAEGNENYFRGGQLRYQPYTTNSRDIMYRIPDDNQNYSSIQHGTIS